MKIAYQIEYSGGFEPLKVKSSANAWWMERLKVERLIAAFGIDCTIPEACDYAQITERQYKYFNKIHPEFYQVRQACRALLTLKARKTVVENLDKSYKAAMRYLERKLPEEFGRYKQKPKSSIQGLTQEDRDRLDKILGGFPKPIQKVDTKIAT